MLGLRPRLSRTGGSTPGGSLLEAISCGPSGTPLSRWLGGIIVAALFAIYGAWCCWTQDAIFDLGSRFGQLRLTGDAAVAYGVMLLSVGAFLHLHFWWGASERWWRWSMAGKLLSLVSFVAAFAYLAWRLLR